MEKRRRILRGVRTPRPHFIRKLRRLNPRLTIRWSDRRKRWIVCERTEGGRLAPVKVLQDENGDYLPFDNRALALILDGDVWRKRNGVASIEEEITAEEDAREEELRKEMRHACEEAAQYVCKKGSDHKTFDMARGTWDR